MANVLDLRRRIRSVKNTRQITKAMKMVSAAKLRRAQERAMLARPYAQMISNVLESLVRRTDIYNGEAGDILHPLLVEREEKNVLVVVVAGDKGFVRPEMNAYALRSLAPAVKDCTAGYSTSRTCEIGLSVHSGVTYRSVAGLVDRVAHRRNAHSVPGQARAEGALA